MCESPTSSKVVVVSGGAESVSIAVVDALNHANIPFFVFSLVTNSILESIQGCQGIIYVDERKTELDAVADQFARALQSFDVCCEKSENKWIAIPTEDDGLKVLHQARHAGLDQFSFSRSCKLRMGGLDKLELFDFLQKSEAQRHCPEFLLISQPSDVDAVFAALGEDAILKPLMKPWRKNLSPSGLKVLTTNADQPSQTSIQQNLMDHWNRADGWLAQERLFPIEGHERSVCLVRGKHIHSIEVAELAKVPRMGGSAAYVRVTADSILTKIATEIAVELDIKGVCELSFLQDRKGNPKLVELNTRPWLQIDLVEHSGLPITELTVQGLSNSDNYSTPMQMKAMQWIQPERYLIGMIKGDLRPRLHFLKIFIKALITQNATVFSVYSSQIPRIRLRWIRKLLRKATSRS